MSNENKPVYREAFLLLCDSDGNMRSRCEPFGVAVDTEEEAVRYVNDGGFGYRHSYSKIIIYSNMDDAKALRE